jgi:hypothetical protein
MILMTGPPRIETFTSPTGKNVYVKGTPILVKTQIHRRRVGQWRKF